MSLHAAAAAVGGVDGDGHWVSLLQWDGGGRHVARLGPWVTFVASTPVT